MSSTNITTSTSNNNTEITIQECPICMEAIEGVCNRVMTECGHVFHCSCLMQNAAHNGFGCPYCRAKMADEPEEEDDEDDISEEEEGTIFVDDVLTSFRMFHQRIDGEEVEPEPEDDDWSTVDGESENGEGDDDEQPMPDASYVAKKLAERGITFEDLVKNILFQEHSNFGDHYVDYDRRSSEIYGQFRAIISQYSPPTPYVPLTATRPGSQDW